MIGLREDLQPRVEEVITAIDTARVEELREIVFRLREQAPKYKNLIGMSPEEAREEIKRRISSAETAKKVEEDIQVLTTLSRRPTSQIGFKLPCGLYWTPLSEKELEYLESTYIMEIRGIYSDVD